MFFELQTQGKERVGGSWEYPWCFSSLRRKKKSVLGVLVRARGVLRASDARKKVCWGFSGVPAAFLELQTQEKECVRGSWERPRRFSSFRSKKRSVLGVLGRARGVFGTHDSPGAALGEENPEKPRIRGFSNLSGAVRGCFRKWGSERSTSTNASLFWSSRCKNQFILF